MTWHVWTIANNRHGPVFEFIEGLSFIESSLYPMVKKEYETKGTKRVKSVPLYANYLFLNYEHCNESMAALEACRWLTNYVGTCSDEEIKSVKKMQDSRYEDLVDTCGIKVGSLVKLRHPPFDSMTAVVAEINNDKITVSITLFGSDRLVKCNIADIDMEG